MEMLRCHLTRLSAGLLIGTALLHGPIAQLPGYHDFADQATLWRIPHFADVVSNLAFAVVALWGWFGLAAAWRADGWHLGAGYRLFLMGLFLTALGSGYYHLAPDNARLIWDRLPIALACAGLLAGVWADTHRREDGNLAAGLAALAVLSVAWWVFTERLGHGDLRPYLLLQALPMVLIPLWQWGARAEAAERWAFAGALLLYVIAKVAEVFDHEIAALLGGLSGHTLKHLLAAAGAALIVQRLLHRANRLPTV